VAQVQLAPEVVNVRWLWVFWGPEFLNDNGCQIVEERLICPDCALVGMDPWDEKFFVESCSLRWASRPKPEEFIDIVLEIG